MVSGAIDWNICPLVLGMTKGYIALEGWPRAIPVLPGQNRTSSIGPEYSRDTPTWQVLQFHSQAEL